MIDQENIDRHQDDIVRICVDYTNTFHVIWPNKTGSQVHRRKNALLYRFQSVYWHAAQLYFVQDVLDREIESLDNPHGEDDTVMKAFHSSSYLFDDVIFNIVSMYDYLAGLIGLVMNQDVDKWLKWNPLVKSFKDTDFGFPKTKERVLETHRTWFDKLANYRAGVYHQKSDRPSYTRGHEFPGVLKIEMLLPDMALKTIPFFKGEDGVSMRDGVDIILERVMNDQMEILKMCFDEKHNTAKHSDR